MLRTDIVVASLNGERRGTAECAAEHVRFRWWRAGRLRPRLTWESGGAAEAVGRDAKTMQHVGRDALIRCERDDQVSERNLSASLLLGERPRRSDTLLQAGHESLAPSVRGAVAEAFAYGLFAHTKAIADCGPRVTGLAGVRNEVDDDGINIRRQLVGLGNSRREKVKGVVTW